MSYNHTTNPRAMLDGETKMARQDLLTLLSVYLELPQMPHSKSRHPDAARPNYAARLHPASFLAFACLASVLLRADPTVAAAQSRRTPPIQRSAGTETLEKEKVK